MLNVYVQIYPVFHIWFNTMGRLHQVTMTSVAIISFIAAAGLQLASMHPHSK